MGSGYSEGTVGGCAHRGVLDGAAGEEGQPRTGLDWGPCPRPRPYPRPRLRHRAHGGGSGAPGPARQTRLHGNPARAQRACAGPFAPFPPRLRNEHSGARGRRGNGEGSEGPNRPPRRVREVPPPQRGEKKTWKALLLFYWRFFPLTAPSQPPHIKTSWPPKRVVASGLLLFGEFSLPCSVPRVRSSCEGTNPYLE